MSAITRSQRSRANPGISHFQILFRNGIAIRPVIMAFVLNPYDQVLDITQKEHLKLYIDGCEGLEKDLHFDGKRENYDKFVKLIGNRMTRVRVKEYLKISTEWETVGTDPELPVDDKIIDLFSSNVASKEEVKDHCDIVWNDAAFADPSSSKLFIRVDTKPTNDAELNASRNKFKLKHTMLGSLIWNSLKADFQLEIGGESSMKDFKCLQEFDGVQLWHFIQKHVNLSMTTLVQQRSRI